MPATLHLDLGREMRGGQWQAFYLLQELQRAGQPATLLARERSPLLERAQGAGLDARPFRLRELTRLASGFDLIHAHDARSHTIAAFFRKPLFVSRRVAFPIEASIGSKWKYARATHFIAVSHYVAQILVDAGVSREKIEVIYDGVALPDGVSSGGRQIVALDSNDPGKGKAILEDTARRAGIAIHFSKNLPVDLEQARLFVYITDSEGLGSAALLAMARGVPVLASAVGGLPEIVTPGVTGILISNNAADIIADAMVKLLQDESLLQTLGRNARSRVESNFTTGEMARRTLETYRKVLG